MENVKSAASLPTMFKTRIKKCKVASGLTPTSFLVGMLLVGYFKSGAFFHLKFVIEAVSGLLRDVDSPRFSRRLHFIGDFHVVAPNVKLEAHRPDNSAQDVASVDTHSHVHLCIKEKYLSNF